MLTKPQGNPATIDYNACTEDTSATPLNHSHVVKRVYVVLTKEPATMNIYMATWKDLVRILVLRIS